jgi:Putative Actinobacterial Holin-X, holin superfamily III
MSENDLRDRSVGELLTQLSEQTSALVRQELALAKAEMQQKGKQAGLGIGLMGGGTIVALGAFGALTAFLILLLAETMSGWVAALLVGLAYAAIAAGLMLMGKNKVSEATPPVPEQTIETVKEDVQWAKSQIGSGSR